MARHTISAEQKETGAPADKLPKVDKPTSTPPTIADAKSATVTESPKTKESAANTESSTIASPPKPKKFITKSAPPLKPTSDTSTKREIDTYFEHHFHPARVFLSPGNKKYPGTAPDYNISSSILVSILSNLSPAALQQFQDEYLNDVYVFIDRLDQFKEFAGVALRFPKVGGRIKLDSRKVCEPERERMPLVLDSPEQQEKLREKIEKLDVWKEEVRKVVLLVGEEMGLDEAALNVSFLLTFQRGFPVFSLLCFADYFLGEIVLYHTAAAQKKRTAGRGGYEKMDQPRCPRSQGLEV